MTSTNCREIKIETTGSEEQENGERTICV